MLTCPHHHRIDGRLQHHLVGICHWTLHQLSDCHLHGLDQALKGREISTFAIQFGTMGCSCQHHRHLLPHCGLSLPVLPLCTEPGCSYHELGCLGVSSFLSHGYHATNVHR